MNIFKKRSEVGRLKSGVKRIHTYLLLLTSLFTSSVFCLQIPTPGPLLRQPADLGRLSAEENFTTCLPTSDFGLPTSDFRRLYSPYKLKLLNL